MTTPETLPVERGSGATVPAPEETVDVTVSFDPKRLPLRKLGTAKYMDVKYRVLWFRSDNPATSGSLRLETELVELNLDKNFAMFKATIFTTTRNQVIATGHGSETKSDFGDFVEKAETKAIGRALALAGYGTQFTDDFDGPVVDSPVAQADVPSMQAAKRPVLKRQG